MTAHKKGNIAVGIIAMLLLAVVVAIVLFARSDDMTQALSENPQTTQTTPEDERFPVGSVVTREDGPVDDFEMPNPEMLELEIDAEFDGLGLALVPDGVLDSTTTETAEPQRETESPATSQTEEEPVESEPEVAVDPEPENQNVFVPSGEVLSTAGAPVIRFSQADYEAALAAGKRVALVFMADWCPNCRTELNNALIPAAKQLEGENLVIFRVNFNDSQTDRDEERLAIEYGFGYQHGKVFIHPDGDVAEIFQPQTWSQQQYTQAFADFLQS